MKESNISLRESLTALSVLCGKCTQQGKVGFQAGESYKEQPARSGQRAVCSQEEAFDCLLAE